ncbi:uncharacterized protein AC631_00540 [Debaryomyces fabryi]|uniref:Uncharacterized protein n=1 Tax=Debaryomyces fabryi TaxID=58627 RepID=A0A0V1Q5G0_9ASCO|nr:uncharacterized protein AC631_00540 [Debaryomyces fabryi]KSA03728.1 hypothetical protein AC631_00540 [Debaryomyces fabryi]CUM53342.1 unnamed protein product [Debaryomyces fabryi]
MSTIEDYETDRPIKKQRTDNKPEIDSSDDEELPQYLLQNSQPHDESGYDDGFCLDTVNRHLLDFDFEKVCLISLSNVNVYCCLVCGKFFQGRSKSSHAYLHSVNVNHRVFMNLETAKTYILPDNYELTSQKALKNLQDIRLLLNPVYSNSAIQDLHKKVQIGHDLNHKPYVIGFIGLNNISANDYANVIFQVLSHIPPIRDFYLNLTFPEKTDLNDRIIRKSQLNNLFGLLVRKIWSSHLFKGHISPHELLQYISGASKKKFGLAEQKSPKAFMIWLLNQLHIQLIKSTKSTSTIFSKSLQGLIKISTIPITTTTNELTKKVDFKVQDKDKVTNILKYWVLSLDLPGNSLFQGTSNQGEHTSQIPQVSIELLLEKYDGKTTVQVSRAELRVYQLVKPLPPYIMFHIDRGLDNGEENSRGNPTVVKFPSVIDMSPYVLDQGDEPIRYKLISSIKHELIPGIKLDHGDDKHQWSVNLIKDQKTDQWVTIRDLEVENCESELMFLGESYIQVWEKC